jgi:hypothetical protein
MKRLLCKIFDHNWSEFMQRIAIPKVRGGRRVRVIHEAHCLRCGKIKQLSPQEWAEWN